MSMTAEIQQNPGFTDFPAAAGADYQAPASYDTDLDIGRAVPLYEILNRATEEAAKIKPSLRMALSEIRDDLDRRTRQWRSAAKIVEQTLQQLAIAETRRSEALEALVRIENEVSRTGHALTMALSSFDESGETKNIDPRFKHSEDALLDLDKVTSDLLVAQSVCRAAWLAYSEALANEAQLRQDVQLASQPN
jgi:hypothetical protein